MGKNHKHKKFLKSEKAKVKLRLKGEKTKFLPKGANVTDTTFKVKPIVVPEQLKAKTDNEPLSKRKLNVKDLLLRLKHHSVSARKESCVELRQIVAAFPEEIIQKHISQLLHEVCPLVLDRESVVRKEAVKLLDCILENTTLEKLNPFFSILSSYIRCATTDINAAVQEDSLLLVDVLLKHAPTLVFKESNRLLPNFFTLLSKFRTHAKADKAVYGQKATNMNWRMRILQRVEEILNVVVKNQDETQVVAMDVEEIKNAETINNVQLFNRKIFVEACPLDFFNTAASEDTESLEKNDYLELLLPILHETWLEVVPETKLIESKQETTVLNLDAAGILNSILKVTQSLFKYYNTKQNGSSLLKQSKDLQKFLSQLLKQFPYSQEESLVKSKAVGGSKCVTQNLMICQLFSTLQNALVNRYYCECAEKILAYLEKCLLNRNYIPEGCLNLLLLTLQTILIENFNNWSRKNLPVGKLLDNGIHYYNHCSLRQDAKEAVFNFLCDVIDNPLLNSSPQYQIFMSSLPSLLHQKSISEKTLDTLFLVAKQDNALFYKSFLEKLPLILDNLQQVNIFNASDERRARIKLFTLFFYIPALTKDYVEVFIQFLGKCKDESISNELKEILKLRCEMKETSENKTLFKTVLYV